MNAPIRSLAVFSTVKMQPLNFDGVSMVFAMMTVLGATPNVLTSSDLLVSIDGVIQEPDVAYVASTNIIHFTTPPSADSAPTSFIVWFQH